MKTFLAVFILGLVLLAACSTNSPSTGPTVAQEPTPLDQSVAQLDNEQPDSTDPELAAMDKDLQGMDEDFKNL
ncbi:MAG: hypothetical protein WC595_00775 [Candidatus Nanoarchaeia archaeon]